MYLAYFVRMVRANQGIPMKGLKYDFEQPWSTVFKCNMEFQARIGSTTGCEVGTWSFLQSTMVKGKREERKKMLASKFTPLVQEICDHALKNGRYKDSFKAIKTVGPHMLNVRKTDEIEVSPEEEPKDDESESDDESGSDGGEENGSNEVASEDEDGEQEEVVESDDELGSDGGEENGNDEVASEDENVAELVDGEQEG